MKNISLIISVLIVFPGAFVYGFFPEVFFDLEIQHNDQQTIFKAIMGLYLAFSSLWILGIYKTHYWKTALLTNVLFMLGLGFGRIVSIFFDGFPSAIFVFGTFGELVLGFYSMYILNKSCKVSIT